MLFRLWLNQMTGFNQRPGQALRDGSSERSGWQLLLAITEALILFSKSEHVMCPSLGHVASTLLDLEVRRLSCSHAVWAAGYHFPLSKQMISAPTPHPKRSGLIGEDLTNITNCMCTVRPLDRGILELT